MIVLGIGRGADVLGAVAVPRTVRPASHCAVVRDLWLYKPVSSCRRAEYISRRRLPVTVATTQNDDAYIRPHAQSHTATAVHLIPCFITDTPTHSNCPGRLGNSILNLPSLPYRPGFTAVCSCQR